MSLVIRDLILSPWDPKLFQSPMELNVFSNSWKIIYLYASFVFQSPMELNVFSNIKISPCSFFN